jgi:AcrR family transcriptional regulator
MTETRRERQRAATIEEIKQIARQRMAENGPAALSLRAIAREMGMTSPALYRYFPSRDDLVTALILDAFNSLAESQEANFEAFCSASYRDRLLTLAEDYRAWALRYPELYSLIFGTPIPNYHAPAEITGPAAQRSMVPFIRLVTEVHEAGQLQYPKAYTGLSPEFKRTLEVAGDEKGYDQPPEMVLLTLTGWGRIHGLVSQELYNHLPPIIDNPGEYFRSDMVAWLNSIGIE